MFFSNLIITLFSLVAFVVFYIPLYVIESFSLYNIAGKRGFQNAWIAWVPVARKYTLGKIADDIADKKGQNSYFRWILLGGGVLSAIASNSSKTHWLRGVINNYYTYNPFEAIFFSLFRSSFISRIIGLAVFVVGIIVLYRIFKEYRPTSAVLFTVLCAIFAYLFRPIFLFIIRNDNPPDIYPGRNPVTPDESASSAMPEFTLPPAPPSYTPPDDPWKNER